MSGSWDAVGLLSAQGERDYERLVGLAGPSAAEERDGTIVHLQQALLAKLCADTVEVFQVHAHQIGQIIVAQSGVDDEGIDDEDVPRIDVGRVEESARHRAHELLC